MALVKGIVALRFAAEVYCWHVSGGKEMYGKVGDLLVTMRSAWVTGNHLVCTTIALHCSIMRFSVTGILVGCSGCCLVTPRSLESLF
jgi:hypothetical protein